MTGPRIILAIVGALLALGGVALGVAGIGTLVAHGTDRRPDGFTTTPVSRAATPARALVAGGVALGADPSSFWAEGSELDEVRLTARAASGTPIFVGIGPADRVAAYLEGASYDVLDDRFEPSDGARRPPAPASRRFWAASAQGTGLQRLDWDVRDGDWAVVVMNADASPGVRADVTAGERWSGVVSVGLELTAYGAGGLVGGIALLVANLRRRRPPPPAPTIAPPETEPEPEPEPGADAEPEAEAEPLRRTWPPEPPGPRGRGTPAPTPGPAILSVVLGVLGLTAVPLVPSVGAVLLALHARRAIDAADAPVDGRRVAVAGLALGWAGIVLSPALIALLVLVL